MMLQNLSDLMMEEKLENVMNRVKCNFDTHSLSTSICINVDVCQVHYVSNVILTFLKLPKAKQNT